MDFGSKWLAKLLYPLGISTDPDQVIIGRHDWLFLGDKHIHTLSDDRRPPNETDIEQGKQIGTAIRAWDAYLKNKGVQLFRIMIGPNKGSVYPEYLPEWAKPASPNVLDAMLLGAGNKYFIDLRKPLSTAKKNFREYLYYKTDTHWNYLGAGLAFNFFAQHIKNSSPGIRWPPDSAYKVNRVVQRDGGDLAKFLRLAANLPDVELMIQALELPIKITQSNFDTKQVLKQSGDPLISAPSKPLLIHAEGALNHQKVLWLRDSFGSAMLPLMAATFSDILQIHWSEGFKPGGRLVQLVDEWRPDYVFITVVERSARMDIFTTYPPPSMVARTIDYIPLQKSSIARTNDLIKGPLDGEYQISGNDPFLDFAISNSTNTVEANFLNIQLTCGDGALSIPVQLFWPYEGKYDEQNSVKFIFDTNKSLIDLNTIPNLRNLSTLKRLRLDFDSKNICVNLKIKEFSLGTMNNH
jgi:hypothetical protein